MTLRMIITKRVRLYIILQLHDDYGDGLGKKDEEHPGGPINPILFYYKPYPSHSVYVLYMHTIIIIYNIPSSSAFYILAPSKSTHHSPRPNHGTILARDTNATSLNSRVCRRACSRRIYRLLKNPSV